MVGFNFAFHSTMTTTSRQSMLARVRAALGRTSASAPTPPENEAIVRRIRRSANTTDLFLTRARAVGMNAAKTSHHQLAREITSTVLAARARTIAVEADESLAALRASLEEHLRAATINLHTPRAAESFIPYYDLDAGITLCPAAIAESGSLVVLSSATTGRAASLVPPIHIAIVREQDILPDLVDVWPFLAARNIPTSSSSFTLITGPSKTADIEGILITGVHGPREVHIYVVSNV